MTREILKDLLPIMQAFADGKKIEFSKDGEIWIETETPTWNTDFVYRIKPESKYRPFKTLEECWTEMLKHRPFGWTKSKATGEYVIVGAISEREDKRPLITWTTNKGYNFSAEDIFNGYTFADGVSFGIKEE